MATNNLSGLNLGGGAAGDLGLGDMLSQQVAGETEEQRKKRNEAQHEQGGKGADYKLAREPGTIASTSTSPLPVPMKPRRFAAAYERSMMRPE